MQILPALTSMLLFGLGATATKKAIGDVGLYRAIFYSSVLFIFLALSMLLVFDLDMSLPQRLWLPYALQVAVGSIALMAFLKGLEQGKAGIIYGISNAYVLVVIAIGAVFFGETLNSAQISGSLLVLGATFIISTHKSGKKLEDGAIYGIITIFGWGYYYSFVKIFVLELGPYSTAVLLDGGVAVTVAVWCMLRGTGLSLPELKKSTFVVARTVMLFIDVVAYNISVSAIGVALTSGITAGAPVITSMTAHYLLKEKLDRKKYAAIVIMVIGLALIFLFE